MNGIAIIIVLALLEYLVFGGLVGRARLKYGIQAPATTGHPVFERFFRVQQNTMEVLVVFIPALVLFAHYGSVPVAVVLGLLFIAARAVYAAGYIKEPGKRHTGAGLTLLINAVLVIGTLIGVVMRPQ